MRGHLTDREVMELVADALEGETLAHLKSCVVCRKEYVRLHTALVDLAVQTHARAERSEAFFHRQRVRIANRLGDRRPLVHAWRRTWVPVLAAAALLAALWLRGEPPPRSVRESDGDHALLISVQHSIQSAVPAALRPAVLLVSEVERGVVQPHQGANAPEGDQP